MKKNNFIILIIIVLFIGIGIGILLSGASSQSDKPIIKDDRIEIQKDIVGDGNPIIQTLGEDVEISQWFHSKNGKEYTNVKIQIDVYKNEKIITTKYAILSNLDESNNLMDIIIDGIQKPDYAITKVINATEVNE